MEIFMSNADIKNKPDWKVLTKRGEDLGSQIGVGFNHKSGAGMTILMDAQPIPMIYPHSLGQYN
jgi:hypothetical protein